MKILLTLLLIPVLAALTCCGCGRIAGNIGYHYDNAGQYHTGTATIDQPVDSFDIEWIAGSVSIGYHARNDIIIEETSRTELTDETSVHWRLENTTLYIRFAASGVHSRELDGLQKSLTVMLPEGFRAGELEAELVSASFEAAGLAAEELDIESVSGPIEITQTGYTRKLKLENVSGRISAAAEQVGEMEISTVSGNVDARIADIRTLELNSVSGNMELSLAAVPAVCTADTTSGSILLRLPAGASFTAVLDTVSGGFTSGFTVTQNGGTYISGSGEARFTFDTVSGSVHIMELS